MNPKRIPFLFRLIVLACLCLNAVAAQAQEGLRGGLRGLVRDADFYVGVPEVALILEPGGQSVRTDAEGRFFVNDLEPGVYRIAASAEG